MTELCGSPRECTLGSALIKSTPLSSIGLPRLVSGFSTNGPPEEESGQSACNGSPCEEDFLSARTGLSSVYGKAHVPETSSLVDSKTSSSHLFDTDKLLKCDIEQCAFSKIGFHSFSDSVEHSYTHDCDKTHKFIESEHDGATLDTYFDVTTPADFWKTDKHSARMRLKRITAPKSEAGDTNCERCSYEAPSPMLEARQSELLQDFHHRGSSVDCEEQYEDSDTDIENKSDFGIDVLESEMVSIFGHDLGLVAQMIPELHARVLLSRIEEITSYAGSESSTSPGVSQNFQGPSSVSTNSNLTPSLPRPKRRRDPDDPDENDQNNEFKKPRSKTTQDRNRRLCFACPFYKRYPQKYCVSRETGRKYRTCAGPGNPELRRLKEHLSNTHKISQCERCYSIFDAPIKLITHRKSAQCQQQPDELKEGIDEDQWPKIEHLFKVKRGKIVLEEKPDKEKWFDLWRILYPGIPLPSHPWYDTVQTDSRPLPRPMENFVSNMDKITRYTLEQKGLPFNKEYHDLYLLGAHQAHGTEAAIKQYIENSSVRQFEEFPSSGASSYWGSSSNLSFSTHPPNIPPATSDGNFEAIPLSTSRTAALQEPGTQHQISFQPVPEDLDLDKWDHSDLRSWEGRETNYQDEMTSDFALATSTSPSWETWTRTNYSSLALPTTDTSQFSLEDFINSDPLLSYGEDFECGKTQEHVEQYNSGGNNQLHGSNFLDDKVETNSLGSREPYFPTDSHTGEIPLSELLSSELEAETYLKSGPLKSDFYKNRRLRLPAE